MRNEYVMRVVDALVVGGGFAGVTAARELALAGRKVVLLEAKDRIGGRTNSLVWHGETVELGGTWVHYLQACVWREVVRAGAKVRSFGKADESLFNSGDGPRVLSEDERSETAAAWTAYFDGASDALDVPFAVDPGRPGVAAIDTQTMAQRLAGLDIKPDARERLSAGLTSWANGSIDDAGALFPVRLFAMSGFSVPALEATTTDFILAEGTGALIGEMAAQADFDMRFHSTVTAVRRQADSVRVELADGTSIEARTVVVALPLNVLGDIEFEPALGASQAAAVSAPQVSSGCKVLIKAGGSDKRVDAAAVDQAFAHVLTDRFFSDGSQLLIAFGPDARKMADAGIADVQAYLDAMVEGMTVEDFVWHDWTQDSCAQGTWAVHRPGWVSEHAAAFDAPVGNLFFAGSDFANGWIGHIDGAIETGMRAARQVEQYLYDTTHSAHSAPKETA